MIYAVKFQTSPDYQMSAVIYKDYFLTTCEKTSVENAWNVIEDKGFKKGKIEGYWVSEKCSKDFQK